MISLKQNMAAFSYESPQIAGAKQELERLEAEYDELSEADSQRMIQAELNRRAGSPMPTAVARTTPSDAVAAAPVYEPSLPAPAARNETSEFAGLRLCTELNQLQSILERTDSARIELAVSQAAFNWYKYNVITPAELPGEPVSPNVQLDSGWRTGAQPAPRRRPRRRARTDEQPHPRTVAGAAPAWRSHSRHCVAVTRAVASSISTRLPAEPSGAVTTAVLIVGCVVMAAVAAAESGPLTLAVGALVVLASFSTFWMASFAIRSLC